MYNVPVYRYTCTGMLEFWSCLNLKIFAEKGVVVLAMGDTSPVFEPPGTKRARKTGERVLGRGHHAEITFKLAVVQIHMAMSCGVPPTSVTLYLKPMNGALAACVPFWNFTAPSPIPSVSVSLPSAVSTFAMLLLKLRL